MPATPINKFTIPASATGYNLTDTADFATLSTGSGNGVKFVGAAEDIVILKNDTGGAAVFTFKVPAQAKLAAYSATVTNPTRSVAAAKTYLMRLGSVFQDAADGRNVTIECDVAGKVLVMTPG
jgi:hypothetical protein